MKVEIVRLARVCPMCASPPRVRAFPDSRELFEGADSDRVVITYQCHVRRCGHVYEIRVRDFRAAQ